MPCRGNSRCFGVLFYTENLGNSQQLPHKKEAGSVHLLTRGQLCTLVHVSGRFLRVPHSESEKCIFKAFSFDGSTLWGNMKSSLFRKFPTARFWEK